MQIPNEPRYDYVYKRAHDLLVEYAINTFPVDPISIIRDIGFQVNTYADVAKRTNTTISNVCSRFCTNVAITLFDYKDYYVFYNNTLNESYMRFSLMHELGHIYLGHLRDFEKTTAIPTYATLNRLSKKENKILELEADSFAGNVLIPLWTLNHFDRVNPDILSKFFGVTPRCGKKRISLIDSDIESSKKSNCYREDSQLSTLSIYGQGCTTCGHVAKSHEKFCSICGNYAVKGIIKIMKYELLDTYDNGKLKQCPVCKNEDTSLDGDYCQICGSILRNYCTNQNCSKIVLPSNARFCPHCGSNTSFSDYLPNWASLHGSQNDNYEIQFPSGYDSFPDDVDEFPFN